MKELYIFCEGATELEFSKKLLEPHLFPGSDGLIHTIEIAQSKHHGKVTRGGVPGRYETMHRDIMDALKGRRQRYLIFTTLIDLYGLPKDFPGKKDHRRNPNNPTPYATALERAFKEKIGDQRFVPHLQLHEFETILFADPESFREEFDDCDQAIAEMKTIANSYPNIEHINDGPTTAPSKRIISLIPAYGGRKPSAGPKIAARIGMTTIREKCPHFDGWLTELESRLRP